MFASTWRHIEALSIPRQRRQQLVVGATWRHMGMRKTCPGAVPDMLQELSGPGASRMLAPRAAGNLARSSSSRRDSHESALLPVPRLSTRSSRRYGWARRHQPQHDRREFHHMLHGLGWACLHPMAGARLLHQRGSLMTQGNAMFAWCECGQPPSSRDPLVFTHRWPRPASTSPAPHRTARYALLPGPA